MLLELDTDPGLPGTAWWTTPGGGVDPGETYREAAVRELREETGLVIEASDLIGPIAHRLVSHGYSDEILIQDEQFFALDVPRFEPLPAAFTPEEIRTLAGFAWMDADDMRADPHAPLSLTPEDMIALLSAGAGTFIEWGECETSTVPV